MPAFAAVVAMVVMVAMVAAPVSARELPFVIASWNIAWLGDGINDELLEGNNRPYRKKRGQHLRNEADYLRLAHYAEQLNASVIALQEVENATAVARVFPDDRWQIFVSSRETHPDRAQRTAVVVRKGLAVKRHNDVTLSYLKGLRYGVDVEIAPDNRHTFRLLSIHLKSGCFSDRKTSRKKACQKLRLQIPYLENWIDARARENIPFAVAGDWNRRLALPDDWVWKELQDADPPALRLSLTGAGIQSRCSDGKYPAFVDHIVLGGPATRWFRQFKEVTYSEPVTLKAIRHKLSDHCPVVARLHIKH